MLVYPAAFLVQRSQHDGAVQHEQRHALAGESWSQGQVIPSWTTPCRATTVGDGRNVVIHEFAHQLDQENGDANGAPYLGGGAARLQRWSQVLGALLPSCRRNCNGASPPCSMAMAPPTRPSSSPWCPRCSLSRP